MKKIFTKPVVIGITTIIALIILYVGIEFLKGINVFKPANFYYVKYDNVEGLAESAPVTLNGYKVGLVSTMTYDYDKPGDVTVLISLDKQLRLPKGTKAILSTDMLGTSTISLKLNSDRTAFAEKGDTIQGERFVGLMDKLGNDILPNVTAMTEKIDSILTSLNDLMKNPALASSVSRLDEISANLATSTAHLSSVMANDMPMVMSNVKGITSNLGTVSSDLTVFTADLKSLPIKSTMNNVEGTTGNLLKLTNSFNNPNSTLGLLLNGRGVYDKLDHTIGSADSLLIDVKKNPKRYINIKLL